MIKYVYDERYKKKCAYISSVYNKQVLFICRKYSYSTYIYIFILKYQYKFNFLIFKVKYLFLTG